MNKKERYISYEDLCNLIANNIPKATPSSVDRHLKGIYKTILKQLEMNNKISFKDFGYFELKERQGNERIITDPISGEKKLYYIEPKKTIFFKSFENFDEAVNSDFELKKKVRKKKKKKTNYVDLLNKANERKLEYEQKQV